MENIIKSIACGQFLSATVLYPSTKVDADLYKKVDKQHNPMFGRITKRISYSGIRLCDYENMQEVIEEREEGKEARPAWYKWLHFPYIAEGKKNGNKYMIVKTTPNLDIKVQYYLDGVEIDYKDIAQYFKSKGSGDLTRVIAMQLDFLEEFRQGSLHYKR
jgi:hypothetical protein